MIFSAMTITMFAAWLISAGVMIAFYILDYKDRENKAKAYADLIKSGEIKKRKRKK